MVLLFHTTFISVDLAHHELFRAKVGKGGISINTEILESVTHFRSFFPAGYCHLRINISQNHLSHFLGSTEETDW